MEAEPDDIPLVTIPPEDQTEADVAKLAAASEASASSESERTGSGQRSMRTPPPPKPARSRTPASEPTRAHGVPAPPRPDRDPVSGEGGALGEVGFSAEAGPPSAPDSPTVPVPAPDAGSRPKAGPPPSPRLNERVALPRVPGEGPAVPRRALPPKPTRAVSPTGKVAIPTSDVASVARQVAPPPRRMGETSGEYPAASRPESASILSPPESASLPAVASAEVAPIEVAAPAPSSHPGRPDSAYAETVRPSPPAAGAPPATASATEALLSSEEATAAARRPTAPPSPISDATALDGRGSLGGAVAESGAADNTGSGRVSLEGSAPRGTGPVFERDRPSISVVTGYQLSAYRERSALVRMLSPFIEDPRPHWQLFMYFLVGIALGLLFSFATYG